MTRFAVLTLLIVMVGILPACSSGSGGSNGSANPRDEVTPQGLIFTYPFNGQSDVVLDTTMVVDFGGAVSGDVSDAFALQIDGDDAQPPLTATQDEDQPNIIRLTASADLLPNTRYDVVATDSIAGGNTNFDAGDRVFSFITRPAEGRPADGDFKVTTVTPGETNEITGEKSIFAQFNAIRVIFNEPLDPATVDDSTFVVTGPDGEQITTGTNGDATQAKLTALGRYIVFDPTEDLLPPGKYTISWTSDIVSEFGKPLVAGSQTRQVLSIGKPIPQTLTIEDTGTNPDDLPDNNLDGMATNNVNISSKLIASNDQPVVGPGDVDGAAASRVARGVETTLSTPGQPGFGDVFPAVIRAGQKFQLKGLSLSLNGDIATPIDPSGLIDVNFINDVDVYLMANDYRNIEAPTAVRLRFDLGIGTLITATAGTPENIIQSLANGVFNQTVLNIQAAGLAVPRANGDLAISTIGTFPINVNRTDNATTDFQLTLVLPALPDDQIDVAADQLPPTVTAQSPTACLYAFGSAAYNPVFASLGASPTALPEQLCTDGSPGDDDSAAINSFPIESSPAITFSEPLDPTSVNPGSIMLTSDAGDVPATYRVEGFSIVIDPISLLQPSTQYTIMLNASDTLKDLAGNAVSFENTLGPGQTIAFTTEPQVETSPTPPLLGTLSPGIPCALEGGDFNSGGDTAGHCVGDDPGMDADGNDIASDDFPVFTSPANVSVDGFFSKLVDSDSIVLANGCLTAGSGDANSNAGATVAVQQMNGSGQCVGAVPGEIALANQGDALTRGFSFRPSEDFQPGTRYWIVVCGTDGSSCSNQIVDADGTALNTNPLNGTGSTPQAATTQPPAGGPDIVIPFDATAASDDYYANQFTLPESDTNGNGQFDDGEVPQAGNRTLLTLTTELLGNSLMIPGEQADGRFASYLSLARPIAIRDTMEDCAALDSVANADGSSAVGSTPNECIRVSLLPGGINSLTGVDIDISQLSATITGAVGGPLDQLVGAIVDQLALVNEDPDQGPTSPIGEIPAVGNAINGLLSTVGGLLGGNPEMTPEEAGGLLGQILPPDSQIAQLFSMLLNDETTVGSLLNQLSQPGDLVGGLLSALLDDAGLGDTTALRTGRILLRFPNDANTDGTQSGYIVDKCTGTFPARTDADGNVTSPAVPYDFEPCFAASLTLVANAPDGQGVALDQQPINVNIVGPVTFEQNGRLAISVRNSNRFRLNATALNLLPATATVDPGGLNFQLVGSPAHGGREFPNR
ncbi:Ig-like domain-containing protein [Salinisphaera aquimarina]|uniref:Ig-like domain-containing protein n=1 Tax=Salinisphaera aquimarina TaxID=2094031 RepID=A0ABV7EJ90_9GAMM